MIQSFYFTNRRDPNRCHKVELRLMVMKGYSTFPKPPELEFHHQIDFNVIPRTLKGFNYCYWILIIHFNIYILFAHS